MPWIETHPEILTAAIVDGITAYERELQNTETLPEPGSRERMELKMRVAAHIAENWRRVEL